MSNEERIAAILADVRRALLATPNMSPTERLISEILALMTESLAVQSRGLADLHARVQRLERRAGGMPPR